MDGRLKMATSKMKSNRRRGNDRRIDERLDLDINIKLEGSSGIWEGTLSDSRLTGCFILGSGDVVDGDRVRIDFPLLAGGTVSIWAEVVNHVFEIGFGTKF